MGLFQTSNRGCRDIVISVVPVNADLGRCERKFILPVKPLPSNPSLDHLKHQAKDLLREHAEWEIGAAQRIREFHPRFAESTDMEIFESQLRLTEAQLTIAREHGFPSWARLKRHVEKPTLTDRLHLPHHERIEDDVFRRAVELIDSGNVEGLRAHLDRHPNLVHRHVVFEGGNYFRNPTLLEFVAENPVRLGTLPENVVPIAKVIIDAGAERSTVNETLMLVSTGSVPRECGVQLPLIDLLCERGAEPESAIEAAALQGEFQAVQALLGRGAALRLPVAAALGRTEEFARLLQKADNRERHLALALAAQFGHVEIVRLLFWMPGKIQTDITRWVDIRIRHLCTRRRSPAMRKWFGC